ncbi:MAG: carboxypeptidase regulatory-like domain-containing protein, partial [Candidatus Cloacimonetes bacterium]|nr:carboxypeptidase regulatory-like domain-containing protein [Candidatus Cloacimonadota bacterium]
MKKIIIFLFVCLVVQSLLAVQMQQIETIPEIGSKVVKIEKAHSNFNVEKSSFESRDNRVELLWQTSDPAAISGKLAVSQTTGQSFVGWYLNDERASLYQDNSTPVWEHAVNNADFDYPVIMTEDGSVLALADGSTLKVFDPSSSSPTWEFTAAGSIRGIAFNTDGTVIFLGVYDSGQDRALVESYDVGIPTPNWSVSFDGGVGNLVISGDGSTLILTQYGGISAMWVLNADDGSIIFEAPEYNQNPPAMSYDASIIVNGDYAGYVQVYEYNETLETYEEKWNFHVGGGGSSAWIGGMCVSADGSTIAVGTLVFITGGYNGEIYLFNTYSPTPIWVYENVGDYAIDIDMNDDGSLIAAACWGPLDNSTPDFFLFRRNSNIPVFDINTPGSLVSVDMASDGSFCTTGGKAVHMRIMGSGGNLYSIDCDLGGGFITGTVNLDGTDDNSGVKVEISALNGYFDYTDYDGNYNINNVPEGTYNVEFSKIGYVPGNIPNVVVVEGQTNDLGEITLYSIGSPPENLTASQASGITVELNWDAPISGDPQGYNIYRKVYEQEPYPETPFATVGPEELSYTDDQALPLVNYYYVVTAELTGGFQSPYSNEAEGWISTGFVVDEISVYVGTTPVIDGEISAGEWDDAFMMDTSDFWGTHDNTIQPIGSVIGYFKMNEDMTELYVAYINYNDTILEDHDEVALYIDDNNDGVFPPSGDDSEGNYWAAYYASGSVIKYRPIYNTGGVGNVMYLTNPQIAVSVDASYLVYEFMVPIGTETWEINPSAQNESSLGIFVLDDNAPDPHGFDGWWPLDNINLFNPTDYGTMTFGAVPQTPPAPDNVTLTSVEDEILITWDMPNINDFSYFNIYHSFEGSFFEVLDTTVGTAYEYVIPIVGYYQFYITTVNQFEMESEASEIVEYIPINADNSIIPMVTKLQG